MIPKKTVYFVIASIQSVAGDTHNYDIARFSNLEKAERCLNLCKLKDNQVLYTADENGNELPVDMESLAKESKWRFSIEPRDIIPIDTFELEGEEYDWRT